MLNTNQAVEGVEWDGVLSSLCRGGSWYDIRLIRTSALLAVGLDRHIHPLGYGPVPITASGSPETASSTIFKNLRKRITQQRSRSQCSMLDSTEAQKKWKHVKGHEWEQVTDIYLVSYSDISTEPGVYRTNVAALAPSHRPLFPTAPNSNSNKNPQPQERQFVHPRPSSS